MQHIDADSHTMQDPVLRMSAERVLVRHRPHLADLGRAACEYCAEIWPCPSAIAASQAVMLAGGPIIELPGTATGE